MRVLSLTRLLALVLVGLAAFGCLVQPKDSVTHENVGPLVSADLAPTTNPATGNPVVLQKTGEVDYDRIARIVKESKPIADAATPPPYQPVKDLAYTAAVAVLYELSRKREQKALNTPPPGRELR